MKKVIKKRKLDGSNNENIFYSKYMPSYKYGLIALIPATDKTVCGVCIRSFRTKKEAENYDPIYPSRTDFKDFAEAEQFFNEYIR